MNKNEKAKKKHDLQNTFDAFTYQLHQKPWLWRVSETDEPRLAINRDMAIFHLSCELQDQGMLETGLLLTGFEQASFSDCWQKHHVRPEKDDHNLSADLAAIGITFDDLTILEPGSHPGGQSYWIDINYPMLQPVFKID